MPCVPNQRYFGQVAPGIGKKASNAATIKTEMVAPDVHPYLKLDDDSHPISVGSSISVFAFEESGRPFCEGHASIDATGERPHMYHVRFRGERVTRLRFVNPDWQQDPARSLALLTEFLRSSQTPSLDDFFPTFQLEENTHG